jgi:hypothetical protein
MSVATVPVGANASSTAFSPGQPPVFGPAQLNYLPDRPSGPGFDEPPVNFPLAQNVTRAPVAKSRAIRAPSYVSGSNNTLTWQQKHYQTMSRENLVREYLQIGDLNSSGPATKRNLELFKEEMKFVRTHGNNQPDWPLVESSLRGVDGFVSALSHARDLVRMEASTKDPGLLPFIEEAVRLCTNAVRQKLYRGADYDKVWVSPEKLKQKAHSARAEYNEKARAKAVVDDMLAQIGAYYDAPSNDDIAGVQPVVAGAAACLATGKVVYGSLPQATLYGLRGGVSFGAGPNTDFLGSRNVFQGGNRPPSNTVFEHGWVPSQMNYSSNAANSRSLVQSASYRENGAEKTVLLAPNHFSIDGGQSWAPNPHYTNPTIEFAKLRATNSLILAARSVAGNRRCGGFFPALGPT